MLYLILGILFIFQHSTESENKRFQKEDTFKSHSVTSVGLYESQNYLEVKDSEEDNSIDANDASLFSNFDNYIYRAFIFINNVYNLSLPKKSISPLLLDIPPPTYC